LLLTAAVSAGEFTIRDAYDIPRVSKALHFINVMTYDFHGAWEKYTGHHSPLAALPTETGNDTLLNMKHAIEYWISQGAAPETLVLGLGSYGRGFVLDDRNQNGFYAPASTGIPAGPYTRESGFWGYNEICERLRGESWTIVTNEYAQAPYAYYNNLWIGYDNKDSIEVKARWAMERGLGGVMIWSVETDDFHGLCDEKNVLIKTMYRTVNGEIPPPPPTTTPDPTAPTTSTTTGRTTSTPPPSGKCSYNGQFIGEKCDKSFAICNWNGNSWEEHVYHCSPGLSYDPDLKQCNWDDVIGC
jgi:chitinase